MPNQVILDVVSLGSFVRERRKVLRLTQADLAMVANVGIRFIVDIENGKETCQIGRALRLMATLDIRLTATVPDAPRPEHHVADNELDL